jgi:hypothetical protein
VYINTRIIEVHPDIRGIHTIIFNKTLTSNRYAYLLDIQTDQINKITIVSADPHYWQISSHKFVKLMQFSYELL